jgi:hypothetical protein
MTAGATRWESPELSWCRIKEGGGVKDDKDTRKRLLALLDHKLFDPILSTRREDIEATLDKHHFDDARRKIVEERQRYHDNCPTATDIKENFLRDLESRSSGRLNENLRSLGLPTYWDVKAEFLRLCQTYRV